jgi:hypothetical protein
MCMLSSLGQGVYRSPCVTLSSTQLQQLWTVNKSFQPSSHSPRPSLSQSVTLRVTSFNLLPPSAQLAWPFLYLPPRHEGGLAQSIRNSTRLSADLPFACCYEPTSTTLVSAPLGHPFGSCCQPNQFKAAGNGISKGPRPLRGAVQLCPWQNKAEWWGPLPLSNSSCQVKCASYNSSPQSH